MIRKVDSNTDKNKYLKVEIAEQLLVNPHNVTYIARRQEMSDADLEVGVYHRESSTMSTATLRFGVDSSELPSLASTMVDEIIKATNMSEEEFFVFPADMNTSWGFVRMPDVAWINLYDSIRAGVFSLVVTFNSGQALTFMYSEENAREVYDDVKANKYFQS